MQTFLESAEKSLSANKQSDKGYWWQDNITDFDQLTKIQEWMIFDADNNDSQIDHVILLLIFAAITGEI